jgi:hypothetical protein
MATREEVDEAVEVVEKYLSALSDKRLERVAILETIRQEQQGQGSRSSPLLCSAGQGGGTIDVARAHSTTSSCSSSGSVSDEDQAKPLPAHPFSSSSSMKLASSRRGESGSGDWSEIIPALALSLSHPPPSFDSPSLGSPSDFDFMVQLWGARVE